MIDFKNTKRVGLLAKIGRGSYSEALAAQVRPAEPRIERAQYLKWVRSVFVLWRHFVTDRLDLHKRVDAPGDLLSVDWDQLIDSSGLEGLLDRIARSIAARNQNYFAQIVKTQPPKIGTQADLIRAFRERNIALIKSVGHDQINQINEVISVGNTSGLRHEEISAQIQERIGVSESRANLIARDQTLKYNSSVHTAQAAAAGIERFTWSTSHDGAVRDTHRELDGKQFRYDDPPVTNDDGDMNLPGEDFQCRCVAIPVIDLFAGIDEDHTDSDDQPRDEAGRFASAGGTSGRNIRNRSNKIAITAGREKQIERTPSTGRTSKLAKYPQAQTALAKLNAKESGGSAESIYTAAGRSQETRLNRAAVAAGLATRAARKEHLAKAAQRYGEAFKRLRLNAGQVSARKLVHLARKVATHARTVRRLADHPAEAASYLYASR